MTEPTPATVRVQALLISVSDGQLRYRAAEVPLAADETVDDAALAAAGLIGRPGVWSHSTSWHRDPDGVIVLTYAMVPDPAGHLPTRPVPDGEQTSSRQDSAHPSPQEVPTDAVAAHACRHLAFLLTEGTSQDIPELDPALVAALLERAPGVAGRVRTVRTRRQATSPEAAGR